MQLGQMVITAQSGCLTTWRISDKEPTNLKECPVIPEDAKWKFSG